MNKLTSMLFGQAQAKAILGPILVRKTVKWTRHEIAQVETLLRNHGYRLPNEDQVIDSYLENLKDLAHEFMRSK